MSTSPRRTVIDKLPVILFVASLCFFSTLAGMAIWANQSFPYQVIRGGLDEFYRLVPQKPEDLADDIDQGDQKKQTRPSYLNPIRYRTPGAVVHDAARVSPGVTVATGFWQDSDWQPGIRLIDRDGNILHRWSVPPRKIWPFDDFPLDTYVHGSYLFPNGDIVFNVEYAGLARMDACGKVLWKSDYMTHHSVFRAEDGNFWVSGYNRIEEDSERAKLFPPMKPPFGEETLIQVSPDGEVLAEISLLEALYNSDYKHLLWHYERLFEPHRKIDVLHLNDVESLSATLAGDFPMFSAGDLIVSSRTMNFVAVLSPDGEVKWLVPGVFTQQHDPDFEQGGWISVFDNRYDATYRRGNFLGGSRIRAINPATNEVRDLYDKNIGGALFYSSAGGKHQLLENGNRLITEAKAARIFEVTPDGETVWEWIAEPYNERWVPEILEGSRYPHISPDMVAAWPCSQLPAQE